MNVGELKGKVDFGILTIREDEFEAVLERLPKLAVVEGRRRYRIRQLSLPSGEAYTIAVLRCVEQGNTDALNTARDLLEDLAPRFLLVVGIAGGVPAFEFTLGDVMVSTRIIDFSVEAVLKDHATEHTLGGGPLHTDAASLAADIRAMVRDGELTGWNVRDAIGVDCPPVEIVDTNFYGGDEWQESTRAKLEHSFGGKKTRRPLVVTGAIASSDRLIKEAETLQVWLKIARQIQAVEMESAGVYKAAHGRVPFLAIRGISDIVGFRRHPAWVTYACNTAAAFMHSFLLTRPISPHGGLGIQRPTEPSKPAELHAKPPSGIERIAHMARAKDNKRIRGRTMAIAVIFGVAVVAIGLAAWLVLSIVRMRDNPDLEKPEAQTKPSAPPINPSRYQPAEDNTVLDTKSGLTWQRRVGTRSYRNFEADKYCLTLKLAGRQWTVPKLEQLQTLVDTGGSRPTIDIQAFPDTPSQLFWTSTTSQVKAGWVRSLVDFNGGPDKNLNEETNDMYPVRCVASSGKP